MKNYINTFYDGLRITTDIFIDADDNAKLYRDYNDYRRDTTANRDIQHHYQYFKLEVEQLVFYKIIRDYINGKWVIVVRDRSQTYSKI